MPDTKPIFIALLLDGKDILTKNQRIREDVVFVKYRDHIVRQVLVE